MSIFEKNVALIKECRTVLYSRFEEEFESCNYEKNDNYMVLEARNKSMYSQYKIDDRIVRMNSNYNPEREAKTWVNQYEFNDFKSTIIMFGIAGGYFAKEVLGIMNNSSRLILIEPEKEVFLESLSKYDMTEIINDSRVMFVTGKIGENNLSAYLAKCIHWTNVKFAKILVHPGYEEIYEQEYKDVTKEVRNHAEAVMVERNTEQLFGKEFAYNAVDNIKYTPNSRYLSDFFGVFPEDMIGVVVAAGPSLDENVSVLHQMKGKAVIFATDTALRALHKEGIKADFVVTVDPKKDIDIFENAGFEDIPLMCKLDSNPKVLDMHKGKKIWINPSEYACRLYNRIGVFKDGGKSGGSVATTTFSICKEIGLKKIVLIGQDLAYKGDVSHANGEQRKVLNEEKSICYVKGNKEEKIKTRGDWLMYLRWYEKVIRDLPEDIEVINATEGGAFIEGTTIMTLQEVCDEYCKNDYNVSEIINEVLQISHEEYNNIAEEFFKESYVDLGKMIKNMEKVITLCNRFERKYSKARSMTPDVAACLKDITKISRRVKEMPVYWLVDEMVKHEDVESVKTIYETENDEFIDNMNMIKKSRRIFELTLAASKDLREHFDEVTDMGER